ncbi:MAG: D-alanine--D-alanine ligase family protein [Christensenellaceae bacterium]|jgi:D-alanine-D-alanine ligase
MINLAVFFGGRTAEHDVSVITGTQFIENADPKKYNIIPVYISRTGEWFTGDVLKKASFYLNPDFSKKGIEKVILSPVAGSRDLLKKTTFGMKSVAQIDVAAIAMHGMHGEDGTLQGLFELADIPYTSAGVTGSAVGMDKIIMKAAFKGMGIPVLDCVYFERKEYEEDKSATISRIEETFSYPLIIKPANLGSSIGISKATDGEELANGIEVAIRYDRRILVEPAIDALKEINCAVVGLGADAKTSLLEQPVSTKEVLDFSEKYLKGAGASKGMKSLDRILPAQLPEETEEAIKEYSLAIFKGFDMKGVVRIDYMIDEETGLVYANEVNTIPGSFAFYLFEPAGLPYAALIDELVEHALRRYREKAESNFAFDSEILKKVGSGTKSGAKQG